MITAGIAWYFWQQATALPDWYDEDVSESETADKPDHRSPNLPKQHSPSGPHEFTWQPAGEMKQEKSQHSQESKNQKTEKFSSTPKKSKKQEIRNFHVVQLARHPQFKGAIKSSRANYENGKLEAGVVIDVSAISKTSMSSRDRKTLDQLVKTFPSLRGKAVYLGIEDNPPRSGEILQLSPKTTVRIGKLKLSLNQLGNQIGSSGSAIRQMLNRELKANKVPHPRNSDRPE